MIRIPGIRGQFEPRVFVGRSHGKFIHIGLSDNDRAFGFQLFHHGGVIGGNDIFKNLIVDAKELTKDLLQGVNYVLGSGILLLAMGFLTIYFVVVRNVQMGSDFILIGLVVSSPAVFLGLWNIKKYFDLRRKYSRLYLYQQEMECG